MPNYSLSIGNVTREFPYVRVNANSTLPIVELVGDWELTNAIADEMVKLLPRKFDVLLTSTVSGVPLTHAIAERIKKPYAAARKRRRTYMQDPLIQAVDSMTLGVNETLWLDQRQAEKLKGKKVVVIGDVVVTGSTQVALAKLTERAGGEVVAYVAAFKQGNPSIEVQAAVELPS
ncbi:phosphoribosyltransferase family protein [Deinococcus roseus]|uniref:Adenine phosphoribosyltransferase n=1 Tax=Deinococcus roseus TaxID=392414 RepID=A0ABQ2CV70_9DEIO|nr:phosphoribosyltransferase family protein [Deinococcus roseus]GGJ23960.1 adenine phosphoribosyltransferase [Deinococcus roseus]